ncbi:hypothetical protein ABZ599_20345 [Streptomyces misionensis]
MTLKEALNREATAGSCGDEGDNTDIEDGDGKGGSGSPSHDIA